MRQNIILTLDNLREIIKEFETETDGEQILNSVEYGFVNGSALKVIR